jgi:hypothetical protein
VAALGVALASLSVYVQTSQSPAVAPHGPISATLQVDGGSWSANYSVSATRNNTAFGLLLEASESLGFEVKWSRFVLPEGVFITSINGTVNGQGGGYWQYWVNDRYGDRAADRREIFSGDIVLWKLDVDRGGT